MEDIQTTDPATRRIVYAALDRELLTRGMDSTDPIKDDLLGRVRILRGYRGEPTVRIIDDTRTLVPPDVYLDQVVNRKADYVAPKSPTGPMRIAMSDKRGLLTGDITSIGRGEIVWFSRIVLCVEGFLFMAPVWSWKNIHKRSRFSHF